MNAQSFHILTAGALVTLQNVVLTPDLTLDEARLEGANWSVDYEGETNLKADMGETKFRVVVSEPNVNRALTAHLSANFPLKNVALSLFSERVKISGNFVKGFLSLPVAVEAVIKVRNGVDIYFDLTDVKAGVGLPPAVVEVVQGQMNAELRGVITRQLQESPFPLYIDEIRTEPGRLIAQGKVRLRFPFASS